MSPIEAARTQNSLPLRQQTTRATIAELSEQKRERYLEPVQISFP